MAKIKRTPKEIKIKELRLKMNDESLTLGERKRAVTEMKNLTIKFCVFCGKEIYGDSYFPFWYVEDEDDGEKKEMCMCKSCNDELKER